MSKALAHSLSQSLECHPVGVKDRDRDTEGRVSSGGASASATGGDEKLFKLAMLYCKHDVSTFAPPMRQL